MEFELELTDGQVLALQIRAGQEGRLVEDLISEALDEYIRRWRIRGEIETVSAEDVELLNRLEE